MNVDQVVRLGETVRRERLRVGMSQAEVAKRAGVSREWLGRLESGRPRLEVARVFAVCSVLDIDLSPRSEMPNAEDMSEAVEVAHTMALEDQALTDAALGRLVERIARNRREREMASVR